MGVRRAVELAASQAEAAGHGVYTLGPLIHNPKVLEELEKKGIKPAPKDLIAASSTKQDLKDYSLIIRAHGIDPQIKNNLQNRGARLIDATCPNVKKSQQKAKALALEGYNLFLAGDAHHGEIAGILGYCRRAGGGFYHVVSNPDEAKIAAERLFETEKDTKTAIIGQTTILKEEYYAIASAIKNYFPKLEVIETICCATTDRQQALRDMLPEVDAVLIIGGKESANTQRLLVITQESGKPCVLIENADEIPSSFFTYETIGLSAGASTPDSVIDEIETLLLKK